MIVVKEQTFYCVNQQNAYVLNLRLLHHAVLLYSLLSNWDTTRENFASSTLLILSY